MYKKQLTFEERIMDFIILPDTCRASLDTRLLVEKDAYRILPSRRKCPILKMGYMHGQLEDHFDFDLCTIYPLPRREREYKYHLYTQQSTGQKFFFIEGEFPVKVCGVDDNCTMFAWVLPCRNSWKTNILVVKDSDTESYKDAKKKYETRVWGI